MNRSRTNALRKRPNRSVKSIQRSASAQRALRESETKYRTLTENITIGIFRSTPGAKGSFLEVNPALVKMLGYRNRRELLAKDVAQIYQNPKDRLMFSKKMLKEGSVRHEEFRLRKKDGTPIVVSETAIAVKDAGGTVQYFDGIVEDITEWKKAEEALRVHKTYFEKLFNSAPEAIVLHDNSDCIVNVNDEFTRMFGYSREEAIGRPINDLVAPAELWDEARMVSEKVLRGERVEIETRRRRKDGSMFNVSILGAPILHEGKQLGDYAIYRDITERKKAEEDLHIQKTYHEKLFNSAPEAIVLHDNEDRVINVNEEFINLFGYTREEAIGKPINELVAPEHLSEEAATLSRKVIHGERVEIDSKRRRKDGTLVDVWIMGAPIVDEGKQMGVYAIYRDITERKKAEEARIRSQEEAKTARNIQMNFLPKSDPVLTGYEIAGKSVPAFNVGGDYYDFIRLDDHRLAIGIGDVSGNGLAASLVMANLQATIRGQAFYDVNPAVCLERANTLLFGSTDARTFISLFFAILDTHNNTLVYANAGQDLPILFTAEGDSRTLTKRGMALRMKKDVTYEQETISLEHSDCLLMYTDGITEAMNSNKEEFGTARLNDIVSRVKGLCVRGIVDEIIERVISHVGSLAQNDDMTLVLLRRK